MSCNCENINVIRAMVDKNCNVNFTFDSDISSYNQAHFVVRKDYGATAVIDKTITLDNATSVELSLTATDMASSNFTFDNGKSQAKYIFGLDLKDTNSNIVIPAFPNVGDSAPLFIVYKSVT